MAVSNIFTETLYSNFITLCFVCVCFLAYNAYNTYREKKRMESIMNKCYTFFGIATNIGTLSGLYYLYDEMKNGASKLEDVTNALNRCRNLLEGLGCHIYSRDNEKAECKVQPQKEIEPQPSFFGSFTSLFLPIIVEYIKGRVMDRFNDLVVGDMQRNKKDEEPIIAGWKEEPKKEPEIPRKSDPQSIPKDEKPFACEGNISKDEKPSSEACTNCKCSCSREYVCSCCSYRISVAKEDDQHPKTIPDLPTISKNNTNESINIAVGTC